MNSDEGDPYRDSGRLCPVMGRVMGHHMFHHCVFGHVLYKVRLLEDEEEEEKKRDIKQHLSDLSLQLVQI